jgi:hypothetical protein
MLTREEMTGAIVVIDINKQPEWAADAMAMVLERGMAAVADNDGVERTVLTETARSPAGTWELRWIIWPADASERERARAIAHPAVGRIIAMGFATEAEARDFDRLVRASLASGRA